MGAEYFEVRARGKNADEAFRKAVADARYEYGNGGYTGTIAEKNDFRVFPLKPGETATQAAQRLEPEVFDKHGPAGCVEYSPGEYVFFGWASS